MRTDAGSFAHLCGDVPRSLVLPALDAHECHWSCVTRNAQLASSGACVHTRGGGGGGGDVGSGDGDGDCSTEGGGEGCGGGAEGGGETSIDGEGGFADTIGEDMCSMR